MEKEKKKVGNNVANLLKYIVIVMFFCVTAYLLIVSVIFKYNIGADSFERAKILPNALALLGCPVLLFFVGKFLSKFEKACKIISVAALFLTLIASGIMSFSYVNRTLMLPGSDPKACMLLAEWFKDSNFSAVVPTDSYLSLWPFQCSFILYLEKTMRLFNDTSAIIFQRLNCIYWLLIIASGYRILCKMCKGLEFRLFYLGFTATYFPLFFYLTVIYGNLPGLAFLMIALMFFVELNDEKYGKTLKIIFAILFAASMVISCAFKSTGLIFAVALTITYILKQIQKINVKEIILIVVTIVLCANIASVCQKYYEHYAHNTCGDGVPSIAFIAMGLQHTEDYSSWGGWNGFHSDTYMETGYDRDETVRISKESIRNSLDEFKERPIFIADFLYKKTKSQWADPLHSVFWGLGDLFDTNRPESFWTEYFEYKKYAGLEDYMDASDSIAYLMIFVFAIEQLYLLIKKRDIDDTDALIMIAFIGGFLFSIIWEAHSMYVVNYIFLSLPFGLRSVENLYQKIGKKKSKD